jgi:hypothetical protein
MNIQKFSILLLPRTQNLVQSCLDAYLDRQIRVFRTEIGFQPLQNVNFPCFEKDDWGRTPGLTAKNVKPSFSYPSAYCTVKEFKAVFEIL